jgi:phage-related protein
LTIVVETDNIRAVADDDESNRPINWISAAWKDFGSFPQAAQSICLAALTIAAEGGKADIAKPMKGLGS